MAHRFVGQAQLGFAAQVRSSCSLDGLAELIDWNEIAALLGGIYTSARGEAAWPPLTMFKALLLSI